MLDQLQKLSIAKEQSNRTCKGKNHSTPPLKRPRIIVPVIRKFGNNLFLRLHLNAPEHTQHFPMPPPSSPILNTERGGVSLPARRYFFLLPPLSYSKQQAVFLFFPLWLTVAVSRSPLYGGMVCSPGMEFTIQTIVRIPCWLDSVFFPFAYRHFQFKDFSKLFQMFVRFPHKFVESFILPFPRLANSPRP